MQYIPGYQHPNCVHCQGTKSPIQNRGLCTRCYKVRDIRCKYDVSDSLEGLGGGNHHRPDPECPTQHKPGTSDKVQVLMERAERDEGLWHSMDAQRV